MGKRSACQCRRSKATDWILGLEDPLVKEMAVHSSISVWDITWADEAGGIQSMGLKESDTTEKLSCCLGWEQNTAVNQRVSTYPLHIPPTPTHTQPPPLWHPTPHWYIYYNLWTFISHQNHPSLWSTLGFILCVVHSIGIKTHIHHCNIYCQFLKHKLISVECPLSDIQVPHSTSSFKQADMASLIRSISYKRKLKLREVNCSSWDISKWWRTFLVVQWLGICLKLQGTWVQSLLWEDPTC